MSQSNVKLFEKEEFGSVRVVIQRAVKPLPSGGGYKAHLNWNFCL